MGGGHREDVVASKATRGAPEMRAYGERVAKLMGQGRGRGAG